MVTGSIPSGARYRGNSFEPILRGPCALKGQRLKLYKPLFAARTYRPRTMVTQCRSVYSHFDGSFTIVSCFSNRSGFLANC